MSSLILSLLHILGYLSKTYSLILYLKPLSPHKVLLFFLSFGINVDTEYRLPFFNFDNSV